MFIAEVFVAAVVLQKPRTLNVVDLNGFTCPLIQAVLDLGRYYM
jgi:hypothetical protein